MTFRRLVIVLLIVGGFWYLMSHGPISQFSQLQTPLIQSAREQQRTLASSVRGALPLTLTEAHAAPEYDSEEMNNISVYKKALPSVVNITSSAQTLNFFFQVVPQQDQGSGFILDAQGHILTNNHVIAGGQQIEVTLANKHRYPAKVIGRDPGHDLALLQIEAQGLTPAVLADSHNLIVGQKV